MKYNILEYMALVVKIAEEYGFVDFTESGKIPTYIRANSIFKTVDYHILPSHIKTAKEIIQFIKQNIDHLKPMFNKTTFLWSEAHLIAHGFYIWQRETNSTNKSVSRFVGASGDKISISAQVISTRQFKSDYNENGFTYLTLLKDNDGNIYKWYSKTEYDKGTNLTLQAKIKSHEIYDEQEQTVIYYAKVL